MVAKPICPESEEPFMLPKDITEASQAYFRDLHHSDFFSKVNLPSLTEEKTLS